MILNWRDFVMEGSDMIECITESKGSDMPIRSIVGLCTFVIYSKTPSCRFQNTVIADIGCSID